MVRALKNAFFDAAAATGLPSLTLSLGWRRKRLLILCYHGFAQEDEHLWDPTLYIPVELFEQRLESLRRMHCNVLPLDRAITSLYNETLPERSVALTVDDGSYDFYKLAFPLLRQYGFPVTVYLTSYYCQYNRPVFDTACSYLLWKGSGRELEWSGILPQAALLNEGTWGHIAQRIKAYAAAQCLSGQQKDELLAELAAKLDIRYEDFCARRLLHLMNPAEVRDASAAGADIQLHTHRHRVYRRKDRFIRELQENQSQVSTLAGSSGRHFCYPGGCYLSEYPAWLREIGIESATTCNPGLATRRSNRYLLPRVIDTCRITSAEFANWVAGVAEIVPHRGRYLDYSQLAD
jgi:peptidoglycan/xylan/chitin deacetylase (PgdA/CDA1 family)